MKVLIVDDEYMIRDGLSRSIGWNALGFSSVETAEHGLEALDLIAAGKPDLVLTDIRMPFMDGLELTTQIKSSYPEIPVIIISGHEEFAYAKKALQLDAFDYILKPINLAELEQVIQKARDHLESEKALNKNISDYKKHIENYIPALREHFILEIIYGKLTADQITATALEFGFDPQDHFAAAIIEIDDFYKNPPLGLMQNQREFEIFLENNLNRRQFAFASTLSNHDYLLLVYDPSEAGCVELLNDIAREIIDKAVTIGLSVTVSTGSVVESLDAIYCSYENALRTAGLETILERSDSIRLGQYALDIEKAKDYIQTNYNDITLSLKSLSKHINMSACYFSVIFKKETGVTYINYLTNIRIEKAKELLMTTNLKVYEIAYEVGYDNPTYFSTLFKKLTGLSPFDYKNK